MHKQRNVKKYVHTAVNTVLEDAEYVKNYLNKEESEKMSAEMTAYKIMTSELWKHQN